MGINTYEVMYIQARDNYPFNVHECIEKLQYVIAADDEHAGAHCLMGCIYEEQLEDYAQAEYYYRMTLYLNRNYVPVYAQFAAMLIKLNKLDEALKIIEAGLKVPGIDTSVMDYLQGALYESFDMYATAISHYNKAKMGCLNSYFMSNMDTQIKRVKDKIALGKKLSKKKEVKEKKKEKSS
jgi:tetratricopeptide (TPR) repeat protein